MAVPLGVVPKLNYPSGVPSSGPEVLSIQINDLLFNIIKVIACAFAHHMNSITYEHRAHLVDRS